MSIIQYDFAALDTLTGDLNRNFARLEQLSGQLRSWVNALAAHWQSAQGAQAYIKRLSNTGIGSSTSRGGASAA